MPLYMDFHIFPNITVEEVKNAHVADLAVQDKYNVKYHQFWVNEAAGMVFCLMEGPDKQSCSATHREAHGNVACDIVEVEPGMFNLFMGEKHKIDRGVVKHPDGSIDVGYRYVLVIDIIGTTKVTHSSDYRKLRLPTKAKLFTIGEIEKYLGKEVKLPDDDAIAAVFISSDEAVKCALSIYNNLIEKSSEGNEWSVNFRMGLSGGQPLNKNEGFFETVIKLSRRLSLVAKNREIIVSPLVEKTSNLKKWVGANEHVKTLNLAEEQFLDLLFNITEDNLSVENFSVQNLSRTIGISQPQLYRKVISITGKSPNGFIRDLKMHKALSLIKEKQHNITEIALQVGYNNPSYFAKCFQEKFGSPPSKFIQ